MNATVALERLTFSRGEAAEKKGSWETATTTAVSLDQPVKCKYSSNF